MDPIRQVPLHLVFVCAGNTCRSPMAALVFGEHLRRAGLSDAVRVSSGGMGSRHAGAPADPRAVATLAAHGYPTEHTAAEVSAEQRRADLLLAAEPEHVAALRRVVDDPARVRLLREFDPAAPVGAGLPDPYSGGADGYEAVLATVERTVAGLLDWVRAHR